MNEYERPSWIPYARQSIDPADIEAVVETLRSSNLTQGPKIEEFEEAVAHYCGAKYAIATNSATSALHIAALAAGLGPGDEHWTSPNTFVASANCGLYCGSRIDFVDIDPLNFCMSIDALEEKLRARQKKGNLPKVIIPVHFAGQSVAMDRVRSITSQYGVCLIEDAAHAIGATYKGKPVGSCQFSEMTVFSFHPVKIITSGEGGMITTNDRNLYEKLKRLRSHGITRDEAYLEKAPEGPWSYEQLDLGYNYRMTDIQAALGSSQIKRINTFVARRNEIAKRYFDGLRDVPYVKLPGVIGNGLSAWHLYVLQISFDELGKTRKAVFEELKKQNVGLNVHYIPVHLQPYYRKLGFTAGQFPNAEKFYSQAVSIPMFYELSATKQQYVIARLRSTLGV